MHVVKVLTLTMSLIGITAMASLAQAAPECPLHPDQDMRQQQAIPHHRYGAARYGMTPQGRRMIFIADKEAAMQQCAACACQDREDIAKQRWQRKAYAKHRFMMHDRQQQWRRYRQQRGNCPCGTQRPQQNTWPRF